MTDESAGAGNGVPAMPTVDADEQFAERLAREVEAVLGVGIALESVSMAGEVPVTIRATCLADGQIRELEGTGATLVEASRDLIRRAAELRLAAAWWRLVGPV